MDCVNVLKTVPELQCTPQVSRECNDVVKEIPYMEEEERCYEVTSEQCYDVSGYDDNTTVSPHLRPSHTLDH